MQGKSITNAGYLEVTGKLTTRGEDENPYIDCPSREYSSQGIPLQTYGNTRLRTVQKAI